MEMTPEEWNHYKQKVDELYNFWFKESLDGRTGEGDMQLIRVLIHRFSSAKFFLGLFVGFLTVGVPAVYGVMKLFELIRTLIKGI